jgi:hypothetical protein
VAVALTAVGVTGGIVLTRGGDDPAHPKSGAGGTQEVRSAFTTFPADAAAKGDGLDQELTAVAADGTVAVAAGGESDPQGGGPARTLFVVSPDGGHTWRQAPVEGTGVPRRISASPGAWLARSDDGVLWTSTDGLTWERRPDGSGTPFGADDKIIGAAATPAGWIAIGLAKSGGPLHGTPVLWLSKDGATWERRTAKALGLPVSDDAVAFTRISVNGAAVTIEAVRMKHLEDARTSRREISWVTENGGANWKVADKSGWRRVQKPKSAESLLSAVPTPKAATLPGGQKLDASAVSGPQTLLVGRTTGGPDSDPVLTVRDGSGHDTRVDLAQVSGVIGRDLNLAALASAGTRIAAGGSRDGLASVWTSTDGNSWIRAALPSGPAKGRLTEIVNGSAGWLAAGPGLVFTSADGAGWTRPKNVPAFGKITDAAAGQAGYLVIGDHATVWHSTDLVTWTHAAAPNGTVRAVTARPGGFTAVGDRSGRPVAWNSPDGRTWAPADLPGTTGVSFVAAKGPLLIAGGPQTSFLSPDGGLTWEPGTLKGDLTALTTTPTGFFATGTDGANILTWASADGRTWQAGKGPAGRITAVAPLAQSLVSVGTSGGQPVLWLPGKTSA